MALLEIENLSVDFPTRAGVMHAVDGITMTLEQGEILGVVGESGSGKSMSMLALMGLAYLLGVLGMLVVQQLALRHAAEDADAPAPLAPGNVRVEHIADGTTVRASVKGDRDPGYGSTSKMLAETGIALLANKGEGGVWTPGALLGDALIERLTANAGLTFQIEE